jgi:hypothetical protein
MAIKRRKSKVPPPPKECSVTMCMQLLGGAWTPNIIWYLRSEPRRFSELMADHPRCVTKSLYGTTEETRAVRHPDSPGHAHLSTDRRVFVDRSRAGAHAGHRSHCSGWPQAQTEGCSQCGAMMEILGIFDFWGRRFLELLLDLAPHDLAISKTSS